MGVPFCSMDSHIWNMIFHVIRGHVSIGFKLSEKILSCSIFKCLVFIVLDSSFFVVELRRRIASSQQAGTSTKPVRIYLFVVIPCSYSGFYLLFLLLLCPSPLSPSHSIVTSLRSFVFSDSLYCKMLQLTFKGIEFELEILEAEHSLISDKVLQLQEKVSFSGHRMIDLKISYYYFSSNAWFYYVYFTCSFDVVLISLSLESPPPSN